MDKLETQEDSARGAKRPARFGKRYLNAMATLLVGASLPSIANAQVAAPASDQPAAAADQNTGLADIVVTARRKAENLRDVPISVAALGGETLAAKNIVTQEDLTVFVPNFRVTNGTFAPLRYIRGFGSGTNLAFEQSVGTFFDGVYAGRAQLARTPFFDEERVEVLRGPQPILFGNSTTAGALNVVSRKPGDTFELDASSSYEFNNKELILQGGTTVPITEGVSLRIAGFSQTLDKGWVTSITPGGTYKDPRFDNQAGRATLRIQPVGGLTIIGKYERTWLSTYGNTLQAVGNPKNLPQFVETNLDLLRVQGQPAPAGIFNNNGIAQDFMHLKTETEYLNVEYAPGPISITSTTAWLKYRFEQEVDGDVSPLPITDQYNQEKYRQFSQELRASGKVGKLIDFQAGGYYQRSNLNINPLSNINVGPIGIPLPGFARVIHFTQRASSWSAFGEATFHLTDKLSLTGGARYTENHRSVDNFYDAADLGTFVLNPAKRPFFTAVFGAPYAYNDLKTTERLFQPEAVVQYKLDNYTTFFAKAVRGAKAGGVDYQYFAGSVNPQGAIFRPEKATSYEVGVKTLLLDRRLSVNLTAFRTDFTDLQVSISNGAVNFVISNAGKARSQGIELETTFRPIPPLTLSLAGAYLDSKYKSFPGAACYPLQPAPACVGGVQDLSGTPTPLSSKWSGTGSIEYAMPIGEFILTSRVDADFRSHYNASLNNDLDFGERKGFVLLDSRLTLAKEGQPWTLSLFGKNLTNKLYTDYVGVAPLATGVRIDTVNRLRQIGLQLGVKF